MNCRVIETADAIERNERITLVWGKRGGRQAFMDAVGDELSRRGWDECAPGQYRRPQSN